MDANSFFNDAQAQFNQSQKQLTELWSESQKQLSDSQKKLFKSWMDSFSSTPNFTEPAKNLEKAVTFQREMIESSLNAQKVSFNLAIETQKQFWDSYFQMTQKMSQMMPNS